MRTKTIELFQFAELSETAKDTARLWFKSCDSFTPDTDEFTELTTALGFSIANRSGTKSEPALYWDTNPIDGAFEARWYASQLSLATCQKIMLDRPQDKETHRIIIAMLALAANYPQACGAAIARHGRSINQSAEFDAGIDRSEEEHTPSRWKEIDREDAIGGEEFAELVTSLAFEFARTVNAQYEYENSNEYVDDCIIANEYEFDAKGGRA